MAVVRFRVAVDAERLAALDEARVYDAASSYNFLNGELGRLRAAVAKGGSVWVEDEVGWLVLRSVAEFLAWARGRFPHAKPAEPDVAPDRGGTKRKGGSQTPRRRGR